jgi:hypothetical protein
LTLRFPAGAARAASGNAPRGSTASAVQVGAFHVTSNSSVSEGVQLQTRARSQQATRRQARGEDEPVAGHAQRLAPACMRAAATAQRGTHSAPVVASQACMRAVSGESCARAPGGNAAHAHALAAARARSAPPRRRAMVGTLCRRRVWPGRARNGRRQAAGI